MIPPLHLLRQRLKNNAYATLIVNLTKQGYTVDPQTQQPTNQPAPAQPIAQPVTPAQPAQFSQPTSTGGFTFTGTAGGFFVAFIVVYFTQLLFIFGWPIGMNYMANYVVENVDMNGKKFKYQAGYGETLSFLFVNALLLVITFGIYMFWFLPKSYRWVLEHTSYAN